MGQARSVVISQNILIKRLNQFLAKSTFGRTGFLLNESGICNGLTILYLFKKANGTEDQFFTYLRKIAQTTTETDFKNNSDWLGKFCIDVEEAFNPAKYLKQRNVTQASVEKVFRSHEAAVEPKFKVALTLPIEEITSVLRSIIHDNDMIHLGGNGHAIGAYKKFGKFYLYDPNNDTGEFPPFTSFAAFAKKIKECLFVAEADKSINIQIQTFTHIPYYNRKNPSRYVRIDHYPTKAELADKIPLTLDINYHLSLCSSIHVNDEEMVIELLRRGADPFYIADPKENATPFYKACLYATTPAIFEAMLNVTHTLPEIMVAHGFNTLMQYDLSTDLIQMYAAYLTKRMPGYFNSNLDTLITDGFLNACAGGNISAAIVASTIDQNNRLKDPFILTSGLLHAINAEKTEMVRWLLELNPTLANDTTIADKALHAAIKNGHYSTFILFAKNYKNFTNNELREAITHKQLRMVDYIKNKNVKITWEDVKFSIHRGAWQILESLLKDESCYEPKDTELLLLTKNTLNGHRASCQQLLQRVNEAEFASDLLLAAATNDQLSLVKILRDQHVALMATDGRAFIYFVRACANNDTVVVSDLLEAGLNPSPVVTAKSRYKGFTAIETANIYQNNNIVLLLLQHPSTVISREIAQRLLNDACKQGNIVIISALKEHGVSYDDAIDGYTPLLSACLGLQNAAISYLLEQGADYRDNTFLKHLCSIGAVDIVRKLLTEHPDARKFLTAQDMADHFINIAVMGGKDAMTAMRYFYPVSKEKLDATLHACCEASNAEAVNTLMEWGAQLPQITFLIKLYKAYGYSKVPADQTHLDILQLAHLSGHKHIFRFIESKHRYLTELKENHRPNPETSASIRTFKLSTLRKIRSADDSFRYDPQAALYEACALGHYRVVVDLITNKGVTYHTAAIDPLVIAAENGHKKIVEFFMECISDSRQKLDRLKAAVEAKHFIVAAAMLENLGNSDITDNNLLALLRENWAEIHTAVHTQLLYKTDGTGTQRDDARARLADISDEKNALGIIIHTTVPATRAEPPSQTSLLFGKFPAFITQASQATSAAVCTVKNLMDEAARGGSPNLNRSGNRKG